MHVRDREATTALLSFCPRFGKYLPLRVMKRGGNYVATLYLHILQVVGPPEKYHPDELELLARLSARLDAWSAPYLATDGPARGFMTDNPVVFDKWLHRGAPWLWQCRRQSWQQDTTRPTLAEAVSRFYAGNLFQPGFYACDEDLRAMTLDVPPAPEEVFLCAPSLNELNELAEHREREVRQKRDATEGRRSRAWAHVV